MATKIPLVQGDTKPAIIVAITDESTGLPIDISASTVRMYFRAVGSTIIKATIIGTSLTGLVNADGTITTTAPYNVAGIGGRVSFPWSATALDTSGDFEGEIEITFADASKQSLYELLKFKVRPQF